MSGFLLNMISRHQGTVDKVRPRMRSMFEPETAGVAVRDNAFTRAEIELAKENLNTKAEEQLAFSKFSNFEKSSPENPPSAPLFNMLQQPVQPDEGVRTSELNLLDKNRLNLMHGQIQAVLERLGQKSEPPESFNNRNGLQNSVSSAASDQTHSKIVSNETGLTHGIEETLRRLTSQHNNIREEKPGSQGHAQSSSAITVKHEADPLTLIRLPVQPETKDERQVEPLIKSVNDRKQPVTATLTGQSGFLQTPPWLTAMQADLNNRWRELNTQSQAEPVVNVTIGRVEIRAVNAEPVKPPQVQAKPTGVLSLDDYLKQRESKGRT